MTSQPKQQTLTNGSHSSRQLAHRTDHAKTQRGAGKFRALVSQARGHLQIARAYIRTSKQTPIAHAFRKLLSAPGLRIHCRFGCSVNLSEIGAR